jgi:hypothetical protein
MRILILLGLIMSNIAFAEVGKVLKVVGADDAFVTRGAEKIHLAPETMLELGDVVSSVNAYVVIQLYPASQFSMGKNSELKISEHQINEANNLEKTWTVVEFMKGIVRSQIKRDTDQEVEVQVRTEGASFAVRGTEFEISIEDNKDVDLDVFEGEVAASSPYIQSFVPEIIKANEGLRFERTKKAFSKRRFSSKFRNHPGFEDSKVLLKKWKEKKHKKSAKKHKKKKSAKKKK